MPSPAARKVDRGHPCPGRIHATCQEEEQQHQQWPPGREHPAHTVPAAPQLPSPTHTRRLHKRKHKRKHQRAYLCKLLVDYRLALCDERLQVRLVDVLRTCQLVVPLQFREQRIMGRGSAMGSATSSGRGHGVGDWTSVAAAGSTATASREQHPGRQAGASMAPDIGECELASVASNSSISTHVTAPQPWAHQIDREGKLGLIVERQPEAEGVGQGGDCRNRRVIRYSISLPC